MIAMTRPTTTVPDRIVTSAERIPCDGNGPALGHPRVWLTLDETGHVECPYCSRQFERAGDGH